jgi:hypothetical protein
MNRDDIIRMAHEAGMYFHDGVADPWTATQEDLERFAELVAAAERETCAHMILSQNRGDAPRLYKDTLKRCATLIKNRGNK